MKSDANAIVPRGRDGGVALSFAQQRLWLLDQLEPAPWAYNVSVVRRLQGALQPDALQRALDTLIERHESLRTTFPAVDGRPVQVIGPPHPCELTVVDVAEHPDPAGEARRMAGAAARERFDLTNGDLFRAVLLRIAPNDHVLALTMHHIVTDAWSEAVLLEELGTLYNAFVQDAPPELPPLPIQYADFAIWQRARMRGDALTPHLDYWLHQLDALAPLLELPSDRARPPKRSGRGGVVDFEISAPLTAELRRVTRARSRHALHDLAGRVPGAPRRVTAARTTSRSGPRSRTGPGSRPNASSGSSRTHWCFVPISRATRRSWS